MFSESEFVSDHIFSWAKRNSRNKSLSVYAFGEFPLFLPGKVVCATPVLTQIHERSLKRDRKLGRDEKKNGLYPLSIVLRIHLSNINSQAL